MPASPIRKLVPYSDAAKKRGVHVYHLNIGQPDLETPSEYFEAISKADLKVLAYSHSAGMESFRNKIAGYYGRLGYGLSIDNILVTTGASEALKFVYMTCLNEGDEIIIPEPFYANYNGFSIDSGVKVVPITTRIEDNFALPPIERFEELITDRTRAIMICNPGNPTGVLYPKESLMKLREIVLKHDLYLFSDEVYREFAYDDLTHHSVLGLDGLEDHAVVFDSVSKRFSACGARIGCIVSRNLGLIESALKFAQARLSPPTLGQIGSEAVYDLPRSYYDKVVGEYVARRDYMRDALNEIEGVFCPEVNGAFYAIVRLPVSDTERFCQWMLESFSYEGATVMMAPAAGFYATKGLGRNEVRIAYVLNQDDLRKAMRCLAEGLRVYEEEVVLIEN